MADSTKNGSQPALSSDWGGLSKHLLATFFAVKKVVADDKKTIRWERVMEQPEVIAPITDSNIQITLNWQSPFENMGPDQQFSTLSAMLQAGGFTSLLSQIQALVPQFMQGAADSARDSAASLEGRSNLTKLNSSQVFNGMPPMQIPVTAHFRAFKNAKTEVTAPMNKLMEWALPQKIAADGIVNTALQGRPELFPSIVPQIIGMKFAGMILAPLVIETMPYPLEGPRDSTGHLTHASLQMQIASLTAIDKDDWASYGNGSTNKNFGY